MYLLHLPLSLSLLGAFVEQNECKLCHYLNGQCQVFDPSTLETYMKSCADNSRNCIDGGVKIEPYSKEILAGSNSYILLVDSACRGGICNANVRVILSLFLILSNHWSVNFCQPFSHLRNWKIILSAFTAIPPVLNHCNNTLYLSVWLFLIG